MGAKRILAVDDNADVLRLVEEALASAGYEVTTAVNARDAVSKGALVLPDLVLLDIGLPDDDGFSVYNRLRAKPASLACPIIFLTAQGDIDSRLHGFKQGAVDYITKPFHVRELLARVKVHLHEREPIKGDLPNPLTEREQEVVALLASGKTYKQVAHALGVSQSTIRNHLHNVYHKLDVVDRAQAVIVCRENGWV
jgi:two-component system, NtrC family, sensor kinase